ncbi:sulfotransferase [Motiliproteus sp. MSK22-1]|uniref:sulfotransferase n=1 Tax=Motiliproteus sp. MSK22-1 TaxID=1897630 RepID=UPI0009774627|nr:sulfotransferase [Motiliproteus sp. MSK22-1]OMH37553.1 hypothetical protein BGP75_09255 [Motiliproteus sp. MSK22-1]
MNKKIYFVSGLPRSGSTLLMNVLGQNPDFYVTPTSGIRSTILGVRNSWDQNPSFRSWPKVQSDTVKKNVLTAMLQASFSHTERPVCFDKSRGWLDNLEMASVLVGGRENLKVLVTVRDMRDVLASFEKVYRSNSAMTQSPQEVGDPIKFKTAVGRISTWIDVNQPVGQGFNSINDAVVRGWLDCLHFVEYEKMTQDPASCIDGIYRFLQQPGFVHDFTRVEQITREDDRAYGFDYLHSIRAQISPQPPQWSRVYSQNIFEDPIWKDIEKISQFWRQWASAPARDNL